MTAEVAAPLIGAPPGPVPDALPDALPDDVMAGVPVAITRKEQALWMLEQVAPDVAINNVPGAVARVAGHLDSDLLQAALSALLRRHQVLRTAYTVDGEQLVKWVLPAADTVVLVERGTPSPDELAETLHEFVVRPFAFDGSPLLRLAHFEQDDSCTLALAVHHLVFDGMSSTVFLQELSVVYGLAAAGRDLTQMRVDEIPAWTEPEPSAGSLDFWRVHLHDFDPVTCELAMALQPVGPDSVAGGYLSRRLSSAAAAVLAHAQQMLNTPDSVVSLTAFYLLLERHGAGRDLTVGLPVNIRDSAVARVIGYHVNILPLRARIEPGLPVREFVRNVRDLFLEAAGHADAPVDEVLVDAPRRAASWRSSLFRHVFNFMPGSPASAYEIGGLPARLDVVETGTSKFDLEFVLAADANGYLLKATYTRSMHSPEQVELLLDRYDALLIALGADPMRPVGEVEVTTADDRAAMARAVEHGVLVTDGHGRALPPGVEGIVRRAGAATGDLGRLSPVGTVEILGRAARRVRRHDAPVQLEDVERMLGDVAGVRRAVALLGPDDGDERLLVVLDPIDDGGIAARVHSAASELLPRAGRPDRIATATLTGDVDDGALWSLWDDAVPADNAADDSADDSGAAAGAGALSEMLLGMYRDALGADKELDVSSNFFVSGGQSLMAAQLVQRIERETGLKLKLVDVFENPSPSELARRLATVGGQVSGTPSITAPKRFGRAETMHGLFDWCVEHFPDTVAVRHDERSLTYRELAAVSHAYAADLEQAGVGAGDIVPVLLARTPELIAVLLAVVRRGAAYAAFDPRWPEQRINELLERLAPTLLITDRTGGWPVPAWAPSKAGDAATRNDHAAPVEVGPDTASAVFFTSGTTGTPKGVVTAHRGIVRLFDSWPFAPTGSGVVMAQGMAATWDAFALDSWAVLLTGGTAVLATDTLDIARGLRDYRSDGVDRIFLPTAVFHMLVDTDLDAFAGLEVVGTGGERLSPAHARRFIAAHPDIPLHNMYGPVESTIAATDHIVTAEDVADDSGVPLGDALPHTAAWIFDGTRRCGPDETGEIYLSGEGLAIGYLDDPDLTADRFHDVRVEPGEEPVRVYRTGDLGHRCARGLLYYDGREDGQVKMRGYRVELEDVERNVRELGGVGSCVVIPLLDGGNCTDLALFYATRDGATLGEDALRALLAHKLPEYLVPAQIARLDQLPVLEDRKIDRHALAALAARLRESADTTDETDGGNEPTGEVEQQLAECFQKVLKLGGVSRSASFFDLGGNSLKAVQLLAEVEKRFDVHLAIGQVFDAPSVARLAELIAA